MSGAVRLQSAPPLDVVRPSEPGTGHEWDCDLAAVCIRRSGDVRVENPLRATLLRALVLEATRQPARIGEQEDAFTGVQRQAVEKLLQASLVR
jgi:hypothetical protein